MQFRSLGSTSIHASALGLGTWGIGGWMWGGSDNEKAVDAIEASLEYGVTLIDTAPVYGLGLAEKLVGKAIAGRRDKVILATKCGLIWDTDKGTYFLDEYDKKVHRYLGPESIRAEIEASLKRLNTDYVDLYQTHWQDETTTIRETMNELLKLKDEGKIRAIGVSNASVDHIKEYQKYGAVDSDQEQFNMLDRHIENDLAPYCRQNDISILAYSALGRGLLTGKIGPDYRFSGDDHRQHISMFSVENRKKVNAMLTDITPIAEDRKLTLSQLVIAWTINRPGITHALVGARDREHAIENAQAGSIALTENEMSQIEDACAKHLSDLEGSWFGHHK